MKLMLYGDGGELHRTALDDNGYLILNQIRKRTRAGTSLAALTRSVSE